MPEAGNKPGGNSDQPRRTGSWLNLISLDVFSLNQNESSKTLNGSLTFYLRSVLVANGEQVRKGGLPPRSQMITSSRTLTVGEPTLNVIYQLLLIEQVRLA